MPVEADWADRWGASANAFVVVEDFAASAHLWSADAFLKSGIPVLHHGAVFWLGNAFASLDVEVSCDVVTSSVLNKDAGAVEWAASAGTLRSVPEGWQSGGIISRVGNTRAVSLGEDARAGIHVPVSGSGNIGSIKSDGHVGANSWDADARAGSVGGNIPVVAGHAVLWVLFALARFSVEELSGGTKGRWAALALASGKVPRVVLAIAILWFASASAFRLVPEFSLTATIWVWEAFARARFGAPVLSCTAFTADWLNADARAGLSVGDVVGWAFLWGASAAAFLVVEEVASSALLSIASAITTRWVPVLVLRAEQWHSLATARVVTEVVIASSSKAS